MRGHVAWTGERLLVRFPFRTLLLESNPSIFLLWKALVFCIRGSCAMSRCFPFPPPGYEKKARTDDVDLLKKENDREKKKHKKKKKDKDKRESKEQKEKDGSDGKRRDKKEKKEKHRDKKEKDKDKDRDKRSALDDKRLLGQSERSNGDQASEETKLRGKPEGDKGEIFARNGKERHMERSSITEEKEIHWQFSSCNDEKHGQNSHLSEHHNDYKFVQEFGRRTSEDGGTVNHLVNKFTSAEAKRGERIIRLVAKAGGTYGEGKEKNKSGNNRKLDGQEIRDELRFTGNALVQPQSLLGMVQTRIDGMARPVEKDIEKMIEGNEKTKQKEGDGKLGNKHKEKNKEKAQKKDKDRDKQKKKEEKAKEKTEHKKAELDKLKEGNKDDLIGTYDVETSNLTNESIKSVFAEGNLRKRKDSDTNGFLHVAANDIKPSKGPRPPSSSHSSLENERILETGQTSFLFTSSKPGVVKLVNKQHKINGVVGNEALSTSEARALSAPTKSELLSASTTRPLSISSTDPSVITTQANEIVEVSRKPHPDSKYLNEILTVPKMEEWSNFDDQEWLLQSSNFQSMKPKVESSEVDGAPQLWSEAMQIESADVCALPYVIPY